MAVIIKTSNPAALKDLIYAKVDRGELDTWARRNRTEELTHPTRDGQWLDKAWFKPKSINANDDQLTFYITFPDNADLNMVRAIYGIYHGRFIEMLTTHFYPHFSYAMGTAKPQSYDVMTDAIRNRLNS